MEQFLYVRQTLHVIQRLFMSDDLQFHLKAAQEKRLAALDEYKKKRNSVVGDLAIKAVEQAIEVLAASEGKHFHTTPRSAHSNRTRWIKDKFPSLAKDLDELWGAYGALGYEGINGERAQKAIAAMERVFDEI
jgi:hypothetical protein